MVRECLNKGNAVSDTAKTKTLALLHGYSTLRFYDEVTSVNFVGTVPFHSKGKFRLDDVSTINSIYMAFL